MFFTQLLKTNFFFIKGVYSALLLTTILSISTLVVFSSKIAPKLVHSAAFQDVRSNKRLTWHDNRNETLNSKGKCALACNKNDDCRSFNFWGNNSCELNNEDVYSTGKGEKILEDDKDCIYFGMRRESAPLCQHKWTFANITNDEMSSGACKINKKRVVRKLGQLMEVEEINTDTESKVVEKQILLDAADGGLVGNLSASGYENVLHWFKLVKQQQKWIEAKEHCAGVNGTLFWNYFNTTGQLRKLSDKLDGDRFWLGFTKVDWPNWKSVDDHHVMRLNGLARNSTLIYLSDFKNSQNKVKLWQHSAAEKFVFACDLRHRVEQAWI